MEEIIFSLKCCPMFPLRFSGSRGQENNFGSIQAEPGALRWSPVVPVQGVSSLRQQPGV